MNERHKELAVEAEKYADENFKGEPTYSEAYDSKFAELIVVECAMFVVTELEGKVGSAIADATANRLEKHFGVSLLTLIEHFGVEE